MDHYLNYLWLWFLAMLGGLLRFLQDRVSNNGKIDWTDSSVYIAAMLELAISGFAGVIAFYVCRELGTSDNILAISVAISGHQGGKAIEFFRDYMARPPK